VRIWHSYGSEHSMNLVLIGTFETVAEAQTAIERMETLKGLAESMWSDDDWRRQDKRMPSALADELMKLRLYDFGRFDVDAYAFGHSTERSGSVVRIATEESDIQGFVKLFLSLGARVEAFSLHTWNEDGTTRKTTGT
jgi:hypothetical protein